MIRVGVDYYPEHWEHSWWEYDAGEMVKAGINTVRLAEFTWGIIEPREDEFCFDWLDEIIGVFDKHDIDVILCTPTNCAPTWLYNKYPETLQVERNGMRTELGIRGHRCMTSKTFERFATRVVSIMAQRYANNPRVIAWQIDNEPEGNHCMCESCKAEFRKYLEDKYGDVNEINKAWGNDVWSGQHSEIGTINPPLGAAYQYGWLNPAYLLDYEKWASVSCADYLRTQRDIIKKVKPDAIITTNACFNPNTPDYHSIFSDYEYASYDNYPEVRIPKDGETIYSQAFALDLIRGYKRQNFWILEQLSGPKGCWMPMTPAPLPNMIKGYAWQTIARGTDLLLFFRWRSAKSGAEMFWHGLFETKKPYGRRYDEFTDFIGELGKYPEIYGTELKSQVAILYSYEQERAFRIQPQSEGFSYLEQLKLWHDGFISLGVNVDIIADDAPLEGYDIIIAATQFIENRKLTDRLESFLEAGGTVVITNRSGVKTPQNNRLTELLPNGFRKLAGCYVAEYDPIGELRQHIKTEDGKAFEIKRWCDVLETESAKMYASYSDSYYKGKPAVTVNDFGLGKCYYVGTVGSRAFYKHMAQPMLGRHSIEFFADIPAGIEVSTRENGKIKFVFVFNNSEEIKCFDYLGEKMELSPFQMKIIDK